MRNIAIDLGGTVIKFGLVGDGRLLDIGSVPSLSQCDFSQTMERLTEIINGLLQKNEIGKDTLDGIGVSVPGIVDVDNNVVLSINKKHEAAVHFDFNEWAESNWGRSILMENDARAALIGEWKYGAARTSDNAVMITLGTGIGGAALINGKLLYGSHFQAGCLGGHLIIDHEGDLCTCGNIGCVESVASSWKLPEIIKGHPLYRTSVWSGVKIMDFEKLFKAYRSGDKLAFDVVQFCLKAWSAGTINMIHAYDPDVVVFGGGVMKADDIILPYIRERVERYSWTPYGSLEISDAELGNSAALHGIDYLLSTRK